LTGVEEIKRHIGIRGIDSRYGGLGYLKIAKYRFFVVVYIENVPRYWSRRNIKQRSLVVDDDFDSFPIVIGISIDAQLPHTNEEWILK
jgi:hypothetical protein